MEGYLRTHKEDTGGPLKKGKQEDMHAKENEKGNYKELEEPCYQWIKCNINPAKVSAIINMQKQMIETKA